MTFVIFLWNLVEPKVWLLVGSRYCSYIFVPCLFSQFFILLRSYVLFQHISPLVHSLLSSNFHPCPWKGASIIAFIFSYFLFSQFFILLTFSLPFRHIPPSVHSLLSPNFHPCLLFLLRFILHKPFNIEIPHWTQIWSHKGLDSACLMK